MSETLEQSIDRMQGTVTAACKEMDLLRAALRELVEHPTVSGMSANIRDHCRREGKRDAYAFAKDVLAHKAAP